jgi:hypothetical protein
VKTSGTTSGDKVIPVTREALASHRKGGWDALLMATERVGARHLIGGPMLFLGGSTAARPAGAGSRVGDLSGLAVRRLPLPPSLRSAIQESLTTMRARNPEAFKEAGATIGGFVPADEGKYQVIRDLNETAKRLAAQK